LLAFAAAYFFRDLEHPVRITAVLILLASLSVHGALLAACLGLGYFTEAIKSWPTLNHHVRKVFAGCVVAMLFMFFLLFLVLKPTADVEEFAPKKIEAQLAESEKIVQPSTETKLRAVISGAFFDEPIISCLFLLLAGAWCYTRKKLITFALPVAMMLALYAVIHGYSHHHGTVFIAAVTGLWIAWPTSREEQTFTSEQRWALQGMIGLLVCLFALNIWDAAVVIRNEYLYPYSGAEDAARYLKAVGAEEKGVFGYLYGIVGVEAYFNHNIERNRPTAYFHHGIPLIGTMLDVDAVRSMAPEYVVFFTEQPQLMIDRISRPMDNLGYRMVHFSDGYLLYKRGVYVRQAYFIFQREAR
jgi:MFS family permease